MRDNHLMSAIFGWRLWLRQYGVAFGAWTLLALLYAIQQVRLIQSVDDRHISLWLALYPGLTTYWTCAILTPPAIAYARLIDFRRDRIARFVLAHIAGLLVFVLLHAAIRLALFPVHNGLTGSTIPRRPRMLYNLSLIYFNDDLFIYYPLVGVALAYNAHRRRAALREQLAGAELQILKMQLHPHFLFNTLQAISTLIGKDPAAARRTIVLLGDLLRAVIDRPGENEVPLRDELDILDRYVQIELVRFAGRLTFDYAIDDAALDLRLPSLILQPLVENAVRHGARANPGAGEIRIAAAVRDGRLIVEIADNGPGLTSSNSKGLGLVNTRARLRALYGDAHSFDLRNRETGGLSVTLSIPARRAGAAS